MQNHSTDSSAKVNSGNDYEFTGGYLHRGLFHLLRDKKISKTEMLLLFVVDSFIKHGKRGGCFASNEYLAAATASTKTYISDSIKHLTSPKLSLLKMEMIDGKRSLETDWSRLTFEKTPSENSERPFGKFRTTLRKIPNDKASKNDRITSKSSSETAINGERNTYKDNDTKNCRSANDGVSFQFGKNGDSSSEAHKACHEFYVKVVAYHIEKHPSWKRPEESKGKKWFTQLFAETSPAEIKKVLAWYYLHLGEKYTNLKILCGKSLYQRFGELQQKMYEWEEKEGAESPSISNEPEQRIIRYKGRRWQKCDPEIYENHNCSWRDMDSMEEISGLHLYKGAVCESCGTEGGCKPDCPADHFEYWQDQHQMGREYLKKERKSK